MKVCRIRERTTLVGSLWWPTKEIERTNPSNFKQTKIKTYRLAVKRTHDVAGRSRIPEREGPNGHGV